MFGSDEASDSLGTVCGLRVGCSCAESFLALCMLTMRKFLVGTSERVPGLQRDTEAGSIESMKWGDVFHVTMCIPGSM